MPTLFKNTIRFLISTALLFSILFFLFPLPGHIPILMYHFIDTPERAAQEKNVVSLKSFKNQMNFLKYFGFRVITMDEYNEILAGKREPQGREVVMTFDDGNYTFFDQAFPVLLQHRYPSAIFVVTENVKKQTQGSMPLDELKILKNSGLVTIGSHSRTHPLLSRLSEDEMVDEVAGSKQELEEMLGVPVHYFVYPSGNLDKRVMEQVRKAGYRLAFTTSPKKLKELKENRYALTRIKISRTSDLWIAFWFKLSGLYEAYKIFWSRLN